MTSASKEEVVICDFCRTEIPSGAKVCRHCHRNLGVRVAPALQALLTVTALLVSLLSLWQSSAKASHDKSIANLQVVTTTLRDLQAMESDVSMIVKKTNQGQNLTTREIYLLNYYQLLTRTLAENKEYAPFGVAKCTNENSVRIRERPSKTAIQVGGVKAGEEVRVLGQFVYPKGETWYYVITSDNKLGWGYNDFAAVEQSEEARWWG